MAQKTKEFSQELKKNTSLPIEFTDETLSSKNVHQKLATSAMKLKKRQGSIDHYAAADFLQEWLDTN
jgi:RNase H-fold protein (predicted Holliday junction resolvase)